MATLICSGVRRAVSAALLAALAALALAPATPAAAATVPNAPSGLAAYFATGGSVAIVWADNSADETGFEIERCDVTAVGCTFAPLASTGVNGYAYLDATSVIAGAYQYRVRAVNTAGASAWSMPAKTPYASGLPSAVMVTTATSGTAPLAVAFDGTGSSGIDFASIVDWSWSFGDGATASGPTASHTYIAAGTYRAALTVTDSRGLARLTSTSVTVSAPVLAPPSNLTAVSTVKRRVDIRWTNPAGSTATTLYVLRCTGSTCTFFSTVAQLAPTATSFSDTTARSGTTYRYEIVAANGSTSATSNVVTIKAR